MPVTTVLSFCWLSLVLLVKFISLSFRFFKLLQLLFSQLFLLSILALIMIEIEINLVTWYQVLLPFILLAFEFFVVFWLRLNFYKFLGW